MESRNLSCNTSSTGISNLGSKDTQKHNSCEWHTGRSLKIVVDTQDCFQGGDRISRKNTYCDGRQIEKLRVEIYVEQYVWKGRVKDWCQGNERELFSC